MKLLSRYVAQQFLTTFGVLVLGLPLLFTVFDVTDSLDKYIDRGLSTGAVALAYLYQIPQFLQWAFPVAALVATVFTISNLTRHQEITAAKAGGVSFYRIAAPIVALGVVLSAAALALGELVPVTNAKRAALVDPRASERSTSFRNDLVFQTGAGRVLSARQLDVGAGEMTGIVLERRASGGRPGLHETAERARWSADEGWRFEDGYVRILGADGVERSFRFAASRVPALGETPEELLADPKDPDEMRYGEMSRFIDAVERSGGNAEGLQTERALKIALPLAVLVIILFGAPLATSAQRGGTAYGIGLSLAVTMVYLLLFRIGKAVGSSGTLDPLLAAWAPNLLFLIAAGVLLWRVRT
jgi:lipopolysaccharide export system permease protein